LEALGVGVSLSTVTSVWPIIFDIIESTGLFDLGEKHGITASSKDNRVCAARNREAGSFSNNLNLELD
jgi:hypothetical protein